MDYYVVTYKGCFGFIKPWTAVRDGETFSQQFLTPSIIEGIEKKLFPEQLAQKGVIEKILRHKLSYIGMNVQQEVTQTRGWLEKGKKQQKTFMRERSILSRGVLLEPTLILAFENRTDAEIASKQHLCLCRNEDIVLPSEEIIKISEQDFDSLEGFELRFGENENSFLVGYNRFDNSRPMYGWLEINGKSVTDL